MQKIIKINTALKLTLWSFSIHSYFPHGKLCKNKYIFQCLLWWDISYQTRMAIPEGSWAQCAIMPVMGCLLQELPSSAQSLTAPSPWWAARRKTQWSFPKALDQFIIFFLLSQCPDAGLTEMKLQQWLLFHLCGWILPALYSHFFDGEYLPIPVLEVWSSSAELNCHCRKPVNRDIPQLSAISNLPHSQWTRSAPLPLCSTHVHCRLNHSVKDLRYLLHRNTSAAYLRGLFPRFSWNSFTNIIQQLVSSGHLCVSTRAAF